MASDGTQRLVVIDRVAALQRRNGSAMLLPSKEYGGQEVFAATG